ncbi:MAG: hypothetical protein U1E56_14220 [Bauldia sp.]
MRKQLLLGLAVLGLGSAALAQVSNPQAPEYAALAKALPNAKHTLAEAIAAETKGGEVVIEAKFEMDKGKLMLGVYTSAKGLGTPAEQNSFKEYNGEATGAKWTPKTEVFKDLEHIARSAQYHTLLSQTKLSIADIVRKASTGTVTVVSVKEIVRNGKPVFEVVSIDGGAAKATYYDIVSGEAVAA